MTDVPLFSPISTLPNLGRHLGVQLSVKEEAHFGRFCGGNKARKMEYFIREAERRNATVLLTTGALQSNHARVTAMAAARGGMKCLLVLHSDSKFKETLKGNHFIADFVGAEINVVQSSDISKTMDQIATNLESKGEVVYVIPGGGHDVLGSLAYFHAVNEVQNQLGKGGPPDWIVLASGTGTTQAGIVVGTANLGWRTKTIGVSVARGKERGEKIIKSACQELVEFLELNNGFPAIDFRDDWTCGGYEQVNDRLLDVIRRAARMDGLLLDPTYTGKAFLALADLVETGEIEQGQKVLFWHTGGLMNLLSSPHFHGERSP